MSSILPSQVPRRVRVRRGRLVAVVATPVVVAALVGGVLLFTPAHRAARGAVALASTAQRPTTTSTPAVSPAALLAQALSAARTKHSFRVAGHGPHGAALHYDFYPSSVAVSVGASGFSVQLRAVGGTTYVRLGGSQWMHVSRTDAQYRDLLKQLRPEFFLKHVRVLRPLTLLPAHVVDGVEAIGIRGRASKHSGKTATLWVRDDSTRLPLKYEIRGSGRFSIDAVFSDWDRPGHVKPPKHYVSSIFANSPLQSITTSPSFGSSAACGDVAVPDGASALARKYASLLDQMYPRWLEVSDAIASHGSIVQPSDMTAQAAVDTDFAAGINHLPFTGAAARDASRLTQILDAYLSFLDTAAAEDGYYASHRDESAALGAQRHDASAALRADLGLPPSTCNLLRP